MQVMALELHVKAPDHVGMNMCVEVEHPDHPDSMWFMTEKKCWICDEPTTWVELNFQAWVCLGACTDEAWRRYWEANREIEERYGPLTNFTGPGYKPSHQSNDAPGGDMNTIDQNIPGPPDGPDGPPPIQ